MTTANWFWLAHRGTGTDTARRAFTAALSAALTALLLLGAALWRARATSCPPGFECILNEPTSDFVLRGVLESGTVMGTLSAIGLTALPLALLLAQAARIGLPERDSRLRALRAAGASGRMIRRLITVETGVASLIGSLVGVALFAFAWPQVMSRLRVNDRTPIFPTVTPSTVSWVAVPLVVLVLGILAARLGLRSTEVAIRDDNRWKLRPVASRSALLALLGLAGCIVLVVTQLDGALLNALSPLLAVLSALVLVVGLARLLPFGVARIARVWADRTGSPVALVAARRLQVTPRRTISLGVVLTMLTLVTCLFVFAWPMLASSPGEARDDYLVPARLAAVGMVIAGLAVILSLLLATTEIVIARRAQTATLRLAGLPQRALDRALIIETMLPLALGVVSVTLISLGVTFFLGLFEQERSSATFGYMLIPGALILTAAALAIWAGARIARARDIAADARQVLN